MVKSRQKTVGKNMSDANDSLQEDPRESILSHVYPYLPSISEEKWIDLLQSDDEDNMRYKIKDKSCEEDRKLEESQEMTSKAFSYVTMCCHMAWMKIIQINFMRIDPGEKSENFEEKWRADTEPEKSSHTNDFWPVPNDLVEKNFERLLNISCNSDLERKCKRESDKDRGDAVLTAEVLFPSTSEAELSSLNCKLEIPLSQYRVSEDYLAKWVSNEQSSLNCGWLGKDTEEIIKLLGSEKRFMKNIDKFPEFISQAEEKNEEMEINRDEASNIDLWHRNMEEKVSFIQKLSDSERKTFLPYLSLVNKCLENDQHAVFKFED
ncbi:hypothetical protein LSTR_LSTR004917 [Laodelphax striatellus]|uniref:Uncharacterized protein n=1 Tax=Laodelphax striatellus TaxID=195883 RepID=A0A482XP79_LAOST|nr:hypothetical protein LSTR_LSTR004917 [Laodelphax striatellus]